MAITNIKKYLLSTLALCLTTTALFAAPLRNYVCIVRGNLPKDTVTFLENYRDTLESRGYSFYADDIKAYLQGTFGSGFVYYGSNGKPYVITNRHVVAEAENVNVEFENEDGSVSDYKELKIVAADEDIDIALIALPETFNRKGMNLDLNAVTDGEEVWSAGFPGLGSDPMWQLGKGIISNSRAKIKELLNPEISTIIQHSAQVDAGNSGGPLMLADAKAEAGYNVIGINTWKAAYRESTNFAIPATIIQSFVNKSIANGNASGDFNDRIKQFVKSVNNKDQIFFALSKYISNDMVSKSGSDAFIDAISKASSNIRSVIIEIFEYDPIEGLRYAIAYDIWKDFIDDDGNPLITEAGTPEESTNGMKVAFTPAGKKEISSLWSVEQGNWRIVEFSSVQASKLGKKNSKNSTSNTGFCVEDPYAMTLNVGALLPTDKGTNGFSGSLLFSNNGFVLFGFTVQSETRDCTVQEDTYSTSTTLVPNTKLSTFGSMLRVQLPLSINNFMIIPYAQAGIGFANFTHMNDGTESFLLTYGAGLDLSYRVNETIAPVVSAGFMHSTYSALFNSSSSPVAESNNIYIGAGLKLFARR